MKRLGNIFSFTFIQHVKQKGYRNGTIIIAFLCVSPGGDPAGDGVF